MTPKIVTVIITLIANAATSVIVLAVMIIAMNGYNEADATYGFVVWLILTLICTILTCLVAFLGVRVLLKRNVTTVKAVMIVSACSIIVSALLNIICGFIGIGTAEFVRVNS